MKDQTRFHNILETKRKLMKHRNTSANLKTNDIITALLSVKTPNMNVDPKFLCKGKNKKK